MLDIDGSFTLASARAALEFYEPASTSTEMLDQIRALEELKSVADAQQAAVTAAFVAARRVEQAALGMPAKRVGQGIPQELGRARRQSPSRAGRDAGLAGVLLTELPETYAALRAGRTTLWRATLVAKETGWLALADRLAVDAELGPRLPALGDRETGVEAARIAYRLDPHGKIAQLRRAVGGRRVGLMPADDGMTKLIATLPLKEGVAVIAALNRAADVARAAGDERSRGQVMADTLVELVTGQRTADGVPLMVDVIITDQALANSGPRANEPATVSGHGVVPAPYARELITRAAGAEGGPESEARVRLRRLFTDPAGRLISAETRSRDFTPSMAELIKLRDQWCATPYCGAPIRHIDHILDWADGGPTSLTNAQGLCEACNYAKNAPGWTVTPMPDGTVRTAMPTGHDAASFIPQARSTAGVEPPRFAPARERDPCPAGSG